MHTVCKDSRFCLKDESDWAYILDLANVENHRREWKN
jgi:hypothetical protein